MKISKPYVYDLYKKKKKISPSNIQTPLKNHGIAMCNRILILLELQHTHVLIMFKPMLLWNHLNEISLFPLIVEV